jgi:two-component system cell cycle sensor histidine kinase/response regulator CckA
MFSFMTRQAAGLQEVIDAIGEPCAMIASDGRVLNANALWREAAGAGRSLPGASSPSVFAALQAARRDGRAQENLPIGQGQRAADFSPLGERQFLVRLTGSALVEVVRMAADPKPAAAAAAPQPAASLELDAFAAAAPFGAALLDGADPFEAKILQSNATLVSMAATADLAGTCFGDLIETASREEARIALTDGKSPVEVKLAHDPARIAQLYLAGTDGQLLAYLMDVSQQKQLELQLFQSQKMQAIGQLAAGVAHDFNNLLMAIEMRLDELLPRHPVGDPSYEGLNAIRQIGMRAADLVRKLLTFSRQQTVQRATLELGELISEFEVLLRRVVGEDVKLHTEYGRNLPLVRADKGQLETAVMNLVVNARDAIRSGGGGVIRLRTARLSRAEAMSLGYAAAPEGEFGMIEVADTGPGIPPEVVSKIFEPFFTTKELGKGTGLGLSTVYGIVETAGGVIHVESKPGEGAAFRIFLPVFTPPPVVDQPAAEPVRAKPQARDLSGAGRILFVEDEDEVRIATAKLLRARGYEVIEACDGEDALALAEANAGRIDLLISDVSMPNLDGPTFLKKARPYLGDAPVLFISGYAEAEFSDLLDGEPGVSFLAKPMNIKTLAERVKQQLQAA